LSIAQPEETIVSEEDQAWAEFAANVGRSRSRDSDARNSTMRWAGVVALLLLVIGMSWFVWGYVHNKAAAAAKTPGVSSALTAESTPTTVASN
jgi:zona occludens toxin (predicted ATPase)